MGASQAALPLPGTFRHRTTGCIIWKILWWQVQEAEARLASQAGLPVIMWSSLWGPVSLRSQGLMHSGPQ